MKLLELFQSHLKEKKLPLSTAYDPIKEFSCAGNLNDFEYGKTLLQQGKCACILVAGGDGTRLNFPGPKGLYPISNIRRKSLFQLFAEKAKAASQWCCHPLQLAFMTSSSNSKETTQFFLDNSNFGLDSKQLSFFRQDDWPILDEEGNFFYQQPGEIAYGPNGNGAALFHLVQSGIAARWKEEGVQYVQFVQIDNPLADPFDAELFGFHARKANEISIKCCKRKDPKESVGVLVELDGKVRVVEYTEMDQKERTEMSSHDVLKHQFANISLFCFSMESLFSIAANIEKMPLHAAHKSMKQINTLGKLERPLQPNGWKFELYIFDTLELVTRSSLLVYPREECFAPLKNAFGVDSPETVREALQANDRRIMKSLTGSASPETLFELAQEFYYPTNLLKETWKGHKLSHGGYIES